jgi:peptide deformylase
MNNEIKRATETTPAAEAEVVTAPEAAAEAMAGTAVADADTTAGETDVAEDEDEGRERHGISELPPEVRERRERALAQVRKFGDPVLRSKARPIDRFDDELRREAEWMTTVMDDGFGVGLAATQVGVMHRMLVYRVDSEAPVGVLVNPKVEWSSRDQETEVEGCLSLPTVQVDVERPIYARVTAQDLNGEPFEIEASGLEARVLQHEINHLDGVLILDLASREQRKQAMRSLREWQAAGGR